MSKKKDHSSLKILLVGALIIVSLIVGLCAGLILNKFLPGITANISVFEINPDILLNDVNNYRKDNGLSALVKTPSLCSVAESRLSETRKNWGHTGFSAARFCTVNCSMGENLAKDYKSEQEIVDAWIASDGHRAIMLDERIKYGCVASDGQYTVLNVSTMIPY